MNMGSLILFSVQNEMSSIEYEAELYNLTQMKNNPKHYVGGKQNKMYAERPCLLISLECLQCRTRDVIHLSLARPH